MTSARIRLAIILVGLTAPTVAPAQMIDMFTDPLPPNACNGQPAVIDGFGVPGNCGLADQVGLPAVFPGATRWVSVYSDIAADARVRTDLGRLEVVSSSGAVHMVVCEYDLDRRADLTGADRIEVEIAGDAAPALPLDCLVIVTSQDVVGREHQARLRVAASAPGTYGFPMASFSGDYAFTLALVSRISFAVGECPLASCSAPFPARAYSLGPLRLIAKSTPARAGTWGQVKTRYR